MKRINWSKLYERIPDEVQITYKTRYEIHWVDSFKDPKQLGEMNFQEKTISIKIGQTKKESVLTYLHELLHAFSDENEIKLTERQVTKLEKKMWPFLIANGNILK